MLRIANTLLTTVGNGVILAAGIIGQLVTRSGPVGVFTDTTDTAANIIAALRGLQNVSSPIVWEMQYINTTASVATLAAGSGVTLTAGTGAALTVQATTTANILVSVTPASGVVTMTVISKQANQ